MSSCELSVGHSDSSDYDEVSILHAALVGSFDSSGAIGVTRSVSDVADVQLECYMLLDRAILMLLATLMARPHKTVNSFVTTEINVTLKVVMIIVTLKICRKVSIDLKLKAAAFELTILLIPWVRAVNILSQLKSY